MKFKIDENLPEEYTSILEKAGFQADTVADEKLSGRDDSVIIDQCKSEHRILITLDLDFGNIRAYPPRSLPGIIVMRPHAQDKLTLMAMLERVIPALLRQAPDHQLWIAEADRIRIRE